jgi:uncharacterized protein
VRTITGLVWLAMAAVPAAASSNLVISQVYGGGGNSGATLKNDFIEIFNRGSAPIVLSGYSVQYASSAGTSWQRTDLPATTLQPGQYYLIQEAAGTGGSVSLPTPDASGNIAMSATAGKVALVSTQTTLSGACPTANVVDFIGFGAANCSEGSATPALTNTTAAIRASNGCTDADSNATDFSSGTPNPRNTATPLSACVGPLTISSTSLPNAVTNVNYSFTVQTTGGSGANISWSGTTGLPANLTIGQTTGIISGIPQASGQYTVNLAVSDSSGPANKTLTLTVADPAPCNVTRLIGDIQGTGATSALVGQTVTTSGIVTGVRSNGFFIQSTPPGDSNPATSDGIWVFTSSAPSGAAVVRNLVCVSGRVAEFGGQTEIDTPNTFATASAQTLPDPVALTAADLNPNGPIDQLEKYSGMRVTVPSLTVTGPTEGSLVESTATATSTGQYWGVVTGTARPFRGPGIDVHDTLPAGTPVNVPRWNGGPQILQVYGQGQSGATLLDVAAGATVTNLTGVLSYFSPQYEILPDPGNAPGVSGNNPATLALPDKTASEITIANVNLQRFYNTVGDPLGVGTPVLLTPAAFANRLNKVSLGIRNVLRLPDIIGVEEVQDLVTLQAIATKVNTDAGAANPGYTAYLAEGNDIGQINVGFLVKSTVTVVDVTQYGKNIQFISPNDGAVSLLNDRPPLVMRVRVSQAGSNVSVPLTIILNHLRSLNGINSTAASGSNGLYVRAKRRTQAEYVANLVQSRQAADPTERIVVMGDLNAYEFSDGYVDVVGTIKGVPAPADQVVLASNPLVSPPLTAVTDLESPATRYSYTFNGAAQELDHFLLNSQAVTLFSRVAIGRIGADYPEIYRNDPNRPERVTDHDWPMIYLTVPASAPASATEVTSAVSVAATGLAYSRLSKSWTGTVTITNTSGTAISAPVQLVLANLTAGDTVSNANGVSAQGPYITAQSGGSLAPGASVSVAVRINGPQTPAPTYTARVFSGNF